MMKNCSQNGRYLLTESSNKDNVYIVYEEVMIRSSRRDFQDRELPSGERQFERTLN